MAGVAGLKCLGHGFKTVSQEQSRPTRQCLTIQGSQAVLDQAHEELSISPGPTMDDVVSVDDYTAHSLQLQPDTHTLSLPAAVENISPENAPTSYDGLLGTLEGRTSNVDQGNPMDGHSRHVEEHCSWVEEQMLNKTSSYVPSTEVQQRHQAALGLQTLSEANHSYRDPSHMIPWTRPQTVQNYDSFSPAAVPAKEYRFDSCEPSMTAHTNSQYATHHHGHPMPPCPPSERNHHYLQCACCRTSTAGYESNIMAHSPVSPTSNIALTVMYIPVVYEPPARESWNVPHCTLPNSVSRCWHA